MLSSRFEEAIVYAVRLHAGQTRKILRVPYASHLLGAASNALAFGADEDEAIAALLHDAVEDQGGAETLREIHLRFGPRVAEIVKECTDSTETPKPPWRERKERFIGRLRTASESVRVVCLADKLDNATTLVRDYRLVGEALWGQFAGGKEGTLWYYRSLVAVFRAPGSTPFIEELARTVEILETLASQQTSGGSRGERGGCR